MEKKYPAWLLPNLLSLDAPIVAVAWAWMFAETWRLQWVDNNIYLLLGGVVWIIYVLDRHVDNQVSSGEREKFSARHFFHARYWKWYKLAVFTVIGFILAIGVQLPKAIFLHGIPLIFFVTSYFFLAIFSDQNGKQPQVFKNIVAGLTFSYGVAVGIFFFRPSSFWSELYLSQEALLFGVLCACNITAIDLWEASRATSRPEEKEKYGFLLNIPLLLLVFYAFALMVIGDHYARPFYLAIMVAAGLLKLINYNRSRFSLNALRAVADAALIAPLPFFWLYSQAG